MGNVTIFSGNFAKTLKKNLNLFDSAYILTGTANPTSVATDAPKGSLYLRQGTVGELYVKEDNGLTTNWHILTNASSANQDRNAKLIEGGNWSVATSAPATKISNLTSTSTLFSLETGGGSPTDFVGQSYTPLSTFSLTSIVVGVLKFGSPSGSVKLAIYNDNAGVPGTLLGYSSEVTTASITTSSTDKTFTFASSIVNNSGAIYYFGLVYGTGYTADDSNAVATTGSLTSSYAGGQIFYHDGLGWHTYAGDTRFVISGQTQQLAWDADAYVQVPGFQNNRNTVQTSQSPINIFNNSVAYVELNRTTDSLSNLTVTVDNIDNIDINDSNLFIIARAVTDGVLIGNQSTLIKTSQSAKIDGQIPDYDILVNLYDPIDTSLPTGTSATIDGVAVSNGYNVLFSNLSSGNNKIYQASGVGSSLAWTPLNIFQNNQLTPVAGESVRIQQGTSFAEQLAIFNGTNFLVNDITRYFDGVSGNYWEQSSLKTSTLTDNTVNGVVFSVNVTGSENWIISYSLKRGSVKRVGELYITSDGTNAYITDVNTYSDEVGTVFTADISAGNLRLLYTTTSTGTAVTVKYHSKRWSDSAGGPSGVPSYTGASGSSSTAAGSPGDVQFAGATGNLNANAKFNWDNSNEVLGLNGLSIDPLKTFSILDNQASPQTILTLSATTNKFIIAEYSLIRGSDTQIGTLLITTNGVSAQIVDNNINTASVGVTFSVALSAGNIIIKYITTSTGSNATMKYSLRRWA